MVVVVVVVVAVAASREGQSLHSTSCMEGRRADLCRVKNNESLGRCERISEMLYLTRLTPSFACEGRAFLYQHSVHVKARRLQSNELDALNCTL